ncbi:hypothetical protein [Fodinibius sediminis]|uniref:Uncharacterized protein n=1 Tax=Fodinibius sediminis TaxID=1214077 RepID=A0A521ASZ9_9BACT|nr:hypothetical protein [Fodinibius sediminis]SMO37760.1 hypothetical protein SAMN06265218_101346 [Fodinibius sediminis]
MINHSSKQNYLHRLSAVTGLIILFLWTSPATLRAQMFSVEEERPQFRQPGTELYVGFEPTSVSYQGNLQAEGAGQFNYDDPLIRLGYSSRSLNLYMGVGGKLTGSDRVAYFDIGGNLNFGLQLYRSRKVLLKIPVRISSRLTNITTDETAFNLDRFRFGSLTAGAGLQVNARPATDFRIQAGAVPSYGFTFASGGLFGGSLGSIALESKIFFDRLWNSIGLSAGYKYDLRDYRVEEQKYDYRIQGHSIQLGVTF